MDDPLAVSRQRMVDDVYSLARAGRYVGPSRLKSLFRWFVGFDVNCYFTVLTHLSLEPGFMLDYVHRARRVPEIYARREHEVRCRDLSQVLERAEGRTPTGSLAGHSGNYAYLSHVKTDDCEDGFFQLVVLGIVGARFYCSDHAAYNDSMIVCTHAALDAWVPRSLARADADRVHREAKAFELAPRVQMGHDRVVVSVALFTAWGGLRRRWYAVCRAFPHQILSAGGQELVHCDRDLWF